MGARPSLTESVVRNHLQAFLAQKGVDAILSDYDDDARFVSESRTYHGKREIGGFFKAFIASLPPGAPSGSGDPSTASAARACPRENRVCSSSR